jgi:hypothetical protein
MAFVPSFHVVESGGRLTLTRSPAAIVQQCVYVGLLVLVAVYFVLDTSSSWGGSSSGAFNFVALLLALVAAAAAGGGLWAWQQAPRGRGGADPDRWTFDRAADEVRKGTDVVCTISDIDSVTVCRQVANSSSEDRRYVLQLKVAGLRKARQGARGVASAFDADIPVVRSPRAQELRVYGNRIADYTGAALVDES